MKNYGKETVVTYLGKFLIYFKEVLGKSTINQSGYTIFEKFQIRRRNTNEHMESLIWIMEQVR